MSENLQYFCKPVYRYCSECGNKAWIEIDHALHSPAPSINFLDIEGVFVAKEIVSKVEEKNLINLIDTRQEWCPSQEGRAKQDYGPKINFLQQKASLGNFKGFPDFVIELFGTLQEKFQERLHDFIPVEFCFLEYTPERGSYIRPHFDDKWIWGDRLVTVNLLSETLLRLTKEFNTPPNEIVISMPPRSLLIIQGEARHDWLHSINRHDIKSRRVAMTWREFGEEILNEDQHSEFIRQTSLVAKKIISNKNSNNQVDNS